MATWAVTAAVYNLDIPGWMPEAELKILEQLAQQIPEHGKAVEVGPFCGRSSWCFSKTMPASASLTCIDIWDPAEHPFTPPSRTDQADSDFGVSSTIQGTSGTLENFLYNTRDCHNIIAARGRSPDDFMNWPEASLDFVFLDGLHHNPGFIRDLHHWYYRLKPGGLICGDDCARTHPDVLWSVYDFSLERNLKFNVERRIWSLKRPL